MKSFSVIIPTHNKREYLEYTLHGYLEQTCKQFELVIVNNGCSDGTDDLIEEFSGKLNIKQVVLEHKVESPVARNEGMSAAGCDNIIHTDDDRIPCPQFIAAHAESLKDPWCISIGSKHPMLTIIKKRTPLYFITEDYSAIQDRLKNDEITTLTAPREINALHEEYFSKWTVDETPDNFKIVRSSSDFSVFLDHFGFIMATGGNTAFNRKYGEGIEFDNSIHGWGCDDNDFFYRLQAQGYHFTFNEQARNFHQEHPRRAAEFDELTINLKYLCHKYNRLEFYLWARTFLYDSNYTALDADRFYRVLSQDSKLSKDYIEIITLMLNQHFW